MKEWSWWMLPLTEYISGKEHKKIRVLRKLLSVENKYTGFSFWEDSGQVTFIPSKTYKTFRKRIRDFSIEDVTLSLDFHGKSGVLTITGECDITERYGVRHIGFELEPPMFRKSMKNLIRYILDTYLKEEI